MHRRLLTSLTAAMLALAMFPAAGAAQAPPGFVAPCADGEAWIAEPGQPIHFLCGWGAQGGPGKLVTYLNSHRGTLVVRDGEGDIVFSLNASQLAALWGEPEVFPADDDYVACAGPDFRVVFWHYWLNAGLPAGTYAITFTGSLRFPVNDGYHTCWWREDGSRLAEPPSLYKGTTTAVSTLIVG